MSLFIRTYIIEQQIPFIRKSTCQVPYQRYQTLQKVKIFMILISISMADSKLKSGSLIYPKTTYIKESSAMRSSTTTLKSESNLMLKLCLRVI